MPGHGDDTVRLSSASTGPFRWLTLAAWIGAFGAATIGMWQEAGSGTGEAPLVVRVLFGVAWILGAILIGRHVLGLAEVVLEGDSLVVRQRGETFRVPLSDVTAVRESRLLSPKVVTVRLRTPRAFGDAIRYMPPLRLGTRWVDEPTTLILRESMASRGPSGPGRGASGPPDKP